VAILLFLRNGSLPCAIWKLPRISKANRLTGNTGSMANVQLLAQIAQLVTRISHSTPFKVSFLPLKDRSLITDSDKVQFLKVTKNSLFQQPKSLTSVNPKT
jgi:hypothetical protein